MDFGTRELLNKIYHAISIKSGDLTLMLTGYGNNYRVTRGFFNGHYRKDAEGDYKIDTYPISVISVAGVCDIEIDFDIISITAKLTKDRIIHFDWRKLGDIPFDVYGVEEYMKYLGNRDNIAAMNRNIKSSQEKQFFVSLFPDMSASSEEIVRMVKTLEKNGFYY